MGKVISTSMAGKRSDNQKGILVYMDEDFLKEIDRIYPREGYSDRTTFIKQSVYEMIHGLGIKLPAHLKASPSRKGKGGKPTHVSYGSIHIEPAMVAEASGDYSNAANHLSTSPSAVPPRRVASTAKAGKPKPKKTRTKKK